MNIEIGSFWQDISDPEWTMQVIAKTDHDHFTLKYVDGRINYNIIEEVIRAFYKESK